MSHGLFNQYSCYVSGSANIAVALLSMQGLRALRFHQKYILCSEDEQRSYGFGYESGFMQWFSGLLNPLICTFCMLPLFNTIQIISSLGVSSRVCQIRETRIENHFKV